MSEEEPRSKSLIIFGRDVSQIPCFRNSFLYGTLGGIGFGLAHFLFTSKVAKSVNYSVYAFSLVTVGFWMQCRLEYSKTKFEMMRLQQQLQERALFEGSQRDPDRAPVEVVEV
ncbi:hypothetical protein HUJ04_000053 [Dendroctonus ponderosae]